MSQKDSYGEHEVLHTLHIMLSNIDDFLLNHEYVSSNPVLKEKIEESSKLLSESYQLVGSSKKLTNNT